MSPLLPILLLGCVVRYGDAPEYGAPEPAAAAEPVDLSDVQRQLNQMLYETQLVDVDRRDRLSAAEDLAYIFREADPAYQAVIRDYLQRVVDIEQRGATMEVPEVVEIDGIDEEELGGEEDLGAPIVEEELGGDAGADPDALPDRGVEVADMGEKPETAEAAAEIAREALAAKDHLAAVKPLSHYRYTEDWALLEGLWQEAVDGWVHAERERAGAMFLEARELPVGAERTDRIKEVLEVLEGLVRQYPESSYRPAIERNVTLVRDELNRR